MSLLELDTTRNGQTKKESEFEVKGLDLEAGINVKYEVKAIRGSTVYVKN